MDKKSCFIIMPFSDPDEYEPGHFSRVYEHLIKPACDAANIDAVRADDEAQTNVIIIDVLRHIVQSDLVLCDLSSRNPNVLYELGVRQAFDLPVVLIKDTETKRIFDIQGIRTLEYEKDLRIDHIKDDIAKLASTINATLFSKGKDVNSLIRVIGINKAHLPQKTDISIENSILLEAIEHVNTRLAKLEEKFEDIKRTQKLPVSLIPVDDVSFPLPNGQVVLKNSVLVDTRNGKVYKVVGIASNKGISVQSDNGDTDFFGWGHSVFNHLELVGTKQ